MTSPEVTAGARAMMYALNDKIKALKESGHYFGEPIDYAYCQAFAAGLQALCDELDKRGISWKATVIDIRQISGSAKHD